VAIQGVVGQRRYFDPGGRPSDSGGFRAKTMRFAPLGGKLRGFLKSAHVYARNMEEHMEQPALAQQ
jgi:hypothetical protein